MENVFALSILAWKYTLRKTVLCHTTLRGIYLLGATGNRRSIGNEVWNSYLKTEILNQFQVKISY